MGMFTSAKPISNAVSVATKKDKKDKVAVGGLELLAELDAAIKALSTLKAAVDADVKEFGFQHLVSKAKADGKRPESFRGVEGIASASIEMRKRGTNSALNAQECELIRNAGLEPTEEVMIPEMFGINPVHAANTEMLARVEAALVDIVPADFIVKQDKKSKFVVSDEVIEKAFANRCDPEVLRAVTCMAVKPKLETTDIATILDGIKDMISTNDAVAAAADSPAAKIAA